MPLKNSNSIITAVLESNWFLYINLITCDLALLPYWFQELSIIVTDFFFYLDNHAISK